MRCSLCRRIRPSASCPRCWLRQPSLLDPPPPPPSPDELARDAVAERERIETERATANRRQAFAARGPVAIALVGCGRRKAATRRAARALYLGSLFRRSLAYAERIADEVFILSALHGLVELDHDLAPYDFSIEELRQREREQWAHQVAVRLSAAYGRAALRVIGLAGHSYLHPLAGPLTDRGWALDRPLQGLGVGARLAWLGRALAEIPTR